MHQSVGLGLFKRTTFVSKQASRDPSPTVLCRVKPEGSGLRESNCNEVAVFAHKDRLVYLCLPAHAFRVSQPTSQHTACATRAFAAMEGQAWNWVINGSMLGLTGMVVHASRMQSAEVSQA